MCVVRLLKKLAFRQRVRIQTVLKRNECSWNKMRRCCSYLFMETKQASVAQSAPLVSICWIQTPASIPASWCVSSPGSLILKTRSRFLLLAHTACYCWPDSARIVNWKGKRVTWGHVCIAPPSPRSVSGVNAAGGERGPTLPQKQSRFVFGIPELWLDCWTKYKCHTPPLAHSFCPPLHSVPHFFTAVPP